MSIDLLHYNPNIPFLNYASSALSLSFLPLSILEEVKMLKTLSTRTAKCQPVDKNAFPYCAYVGYDMIALPNFVGHSSQQKELKELKIFLPLFSTECSGATMQFLCSFYLQPCFKDNEEVHKPCKELCKICHGGCEAELASTDVKNLAHLQCSRFPFRDEDSMLRTRPGSI